MGTFVTLSLLDISVSHRYNERHFWKEGLYLFWALFPFGRGELLTKKRVTLHSEPQEQEEVRGGRPKYYRYDSSCVEEAARIQ